MCHFHQPAGLSCHSSRSACYEQQQPAITGQRSLITIYHSRFPTLPLYSLVIAYYLAGNTSISSRPFAALTQAAKVAKKAPREEPFLFLLLCHLRFPLRTFLSLRISPSPCLPLSVSTLSRAPPITRSSSLLPHRSRFIVPHRSPIGHCTLLSCEEHKHFLSPVRCAYSSRQGREESNARRALSFLDYLPVIIHHASRITHDSSLFSTHYGSLPALSPCLPLPSPLSPSSFFAHHASLITFLAIWCG